MVLGDGMFKYHKKLAPRVWESRVRLNPLVNQTLQMTVWEFVRYLSMVAKLPIEKSDVVDVFIHGSITNYYWDKCSDIDVCILADLSRLRAAMPGDAGVVLRALKWSWKRMFYISVFGRGVDITIVDKNDVPKPGSKYSLLRDMWVVVPIRLTNNELRQIRVSAYKRYRVIMRQCRYILRHNKSHEFIDSYLNSLQQIRTNSVCLSHAQPITPMAMAFKMSRNTQIFRKLRRRAKESRSGCFKHKKIPQVGDFFVFKICVLG